jgi:hypothetical protein
MTARERFERLWAEHHAAVHAYAVRRWRRTPYDRNVHPDAPPIGQ